MTAAVRWPRIRRAAWGTITVFILLVMPAIGRAEGFFREPADLPLMPGLHELTDEAIVFEYPEGRLVKVAARGILTAEAVLAYYAAALPEFGWDVVARDKYRRDGERLSMELSSQRRQVTIRISITPE
jgi:hypothetical protein